jgi:hypothetical protein
MRDKIITILICLAHLSERLDNLLLEIEKMYQVLGDKEFLDQIEKLCDKE